jgi:predicted secreted Zn-dependent protease
VGALLHPGAVGEAEAIGLLDDRCSHPATQLEAYATCRSLQAALADAQPDTGDLAEATDTEQTPTVAAATASEPPARSPTAAARPVNQSIPVPGPDGRVKLPRKLRAEVPGATRVQYFSVAGRSASALVTQTLRRAAPHCGVHNALACVNLTWHVETTQHTEAGACTVVDATSAVSSVVHLPRWTKPKRVDAELLTWWRRVLADSARHEARHIRILQKELTQLRKRLVGRPCSSVHRLIDRARQRANKSQAVFDRRESAKPLPPAP